MIKTEIVIVKPELAKEWLLHNRINRSIKRDRVVQWSRVMAAKGWKFTGESIKFDQDNNLIDGQHRLTACVLANTEFTTLVTWGLETEAQDAMDTNIPRSPADQLHFHGYSNPKELAAIIRVHHVYKLGLIKHCMTQISTRDTLTNTEAVAYANEHPELKDAAAFAAHSRKFLKLPSGSVGTAYAEFLNIDPTDTYEFFSRIAELKTTGTGDPIHTLIRRIDELRSGIRYKTSLVQSTGLYMLFRTWNACRSGEKLSKLHFGSEMSGWAPIPEPK